MKNYRYFLKINELTASIVTALFLTGNAAAVNTQIQTDGTLSGIAELNINAPGSGHLYTLSEINGKLSGHNLFYSFSNFSIGTADTAWFNLNTADLANVISRVTGGSESLIDGKLQMSNVGSVPSFYFINPAGITFSSGASVDVPGSFYVSTASGLNFSDGSQYAANETVSSSLTSANPESFGFLGDESGGIKIGDLDSDRTELAFQPGTSAAFVGNQVQIENAEVFNADTSQSGINLQFISSDIGTIKIGSGNFINQTIFADLIIQNSKIKASGNGSGYLGIQSDNISIFDSKLYVDNTGNIPMRDWHGVSIIAQSQMIVDNSVITNDAFSVLDAGPGGDAGKIALTTGGLLTLINGSSISASTFSHGNSGKVTVNAGQLEINGDGSDAVTGIISQAAKGNGNAGEVSVTVMGLLKLLNGGSIDASTFTQGNAGKVNVNVGQLEINEVSSILPSWISSQTAAGSTGQAGEVSVTVMGLLKLLNGGLIDASTFTQRSAGKVTVNAGQLEINEHGYNLATGISSQATKSSTGNAGEVSVTTGLMELLGGGTIDANTFSSGKAGKVTVNAGELVVDGQGFARATGILSVANANSIGNAGTVTVTVDGLLRVLNGGQISSSTYADGNAGNVEVNAKSLEIEGQNFQKGFTGISSQSLGGLSKTGNSGEVSISVDGLTRLLSGGTIDTTTFTAGNAGKINFYTKELQINGSGSAVFTGILSNTHSNGDAGEISVSVADSLKQSNNGKISTATNAQGAAGNITINAGSLEIDHSGILSSVEGNSGGQTGSIEITVDRDMSLNNGALISISNEADVVESGLLKLIPTNIKINTENLFLSDSSITTQSSGNVDAGSIHIHFADQLFLDPSQISTEAASGNGGAITIQGNGAVFLLDSAITTSVSGQSGNGGDITISANGLILDSGFIQANTVASGASGGNVDIKTPALIPSGNSLFVGGNTPFQFQPFSGLNVIQAAAPDGVSGTINTSTPQLNLNAMLTSLVVESFDANALNRDMCAVSESSSLMQSGKGAQPLRARDLLLSPMF